MSVHFTTFGCKANQYDTERMRQELEARGVAPGRAADAAVFVVNTCTVTHQADADARRAIHRIHRDRPEARIVVAGCSSALDPERYRRMPGVAAVIAGHDPTSVADAVLPSSETLVPLTVRRSLERLDHEPVGAEVLRTRRGRTRGWLKVQDGCDRKCSFCATRIARGESRSRSADELIAEARALAKHHPELVVTGIHIGHYGRDLDPALTLSALLTRLLEDVPEVRFRLGSVEATEIDDALLELIADAPGLVPHVHMPLQSGSNRVLSRMRRWHTREQVRTRALELAGRTERLGLGADVITGFPGETDADHAETRALIEELPYTYLHVFPFSARRGTAAWDLPDRVDSRLAAERARELRDLVTVKAAAYRAGRVGHAAAVLVEGRGQGLTEDYLRVRVEGEVPGGTLLEGTLRGSADDLYIQARERPEASVRRDGPTVAAST